jgi:hypothetical protein
MVIDISGRFTQSNVKISTKSFDQVEMNTWYLNINCIPKYTYIYNSSYTFLVLFHSHTLFSLDYHILICLSFSPEHATMTLPEQLGEIIKQLEK